MPGRLGGVKVRIGVGTGTLPATALSPLVARLERLDVDSLWLSVQLSARSVEPMAGMAFALGYLMFRGRVLGVYFSIITQALTLIGTLVFDGQQPYTGGTNGMTNFGTLFGRDRTTVRHGCGLVEDRRDEPAFEQELLELEASYADPNGEVQTADLPTTFWPAYDATSP